MVGPRLGQPARQGPGTLQVERVKLIFATGIEAIGGEIDPARSLIDPRHFADYPRNRGQRRDLSLAPEIKLPPARPFGRKQDRSVLQRLQIIAQRNKGRASIREQQGRASGRRIDPKHVDLRLVAVLTLDQQRRSVGKPVDPRQIDVRVRSEVGLDRVRTVRVHHIEIDHRVRSPGTRIALLDGGRLVGPDRGPGGQLDPALVDPRHGDAAVARPPPMALGPIHFFLRDELGHAPADRVRRTAGNLGGRSRRKIDDMKLVIANERNEASGFADRAIEFARRSRSQSADGSVEARKVGKVEVAVERDEQGLAVGRPVVGNDPGQVADPRPLALHLFRFAEGRARTQFLAVEQHPFCPRRRVDRPQVVALDVVGAVSKQSHQSPVG